MDGSLIPQSADDMMEIITQASSTRDLGHGISWRVAPPSIYGGELSELFTDCMPSLQTII